MLATREALSEVTLKDGFTMAIGGLIENNASKGQTKVPLLGDIPGLGRLFRSNNISSDKRNLVIFITAKPLSSEGAPIEQIFNFRAIRGLNMPRDELPSYRDGSDPFIKPPHPRPTRRPGPSPNSRPVPESPTPILFRQSAVPEPARL